MTRNPGKLVSVSKHQAFARVFNERQNAEDATVRQRISYKVHCPALICSV
jgi:hypothetical protein